MNFTVAFKDIFVKSIEEKFKEKKPEILQMNMKALEKGIAFGEKVK